MLLRLLRNGYGRASPRDRCLRYVLERAFDQVSFDVALHEQPVIFCIDRAGITGPDGASHHGLLDMVLLTKVPGMTMFAPSSYQELQQMFSDALKITSGPVAIRYREHLPLRFLKPRLGLD